MRRFALIAVLHFSGIVTSREIFLNFSTGVKNVTAKEGETVNINFTISGYVHKVKLEGKNGTRLIRYCSHTEKMSGCEKNITSNHTSVHIGHGIVSVVFRNVTASGDAAVYTIHLVGDEVKNTSFKLIIEPLEINSSTDAPPHNTTHPPDQKNTKGVQWVANVLLIIAAVVAVAVAAIFGWKYRPIRRFFQSKFHRHTSVPSEDCNEEAAL